jgi:hypothetical protein
VTSGNWNSDIQDTEPGRHSLSFGLRGVTGRKRQYPGSIVGFSMILHRVPIPERSGER